MAALALAGCVQGVDVAVEQAAGKAVVNVTRDGKPPCIRRLNVYEGEPGGEPAWYIIGDARTPCTTRVELGRVPEGFEQAPTASAFSLKPGQTYLVEVGGVAYLGGARFTAAG